MRAKLGGLLGLAAIVLAMLYFLWMSLSTRDTESRLGYLGIFAVLFVALGQQLDSLGFYGEKEESLERKLTEVYSPIHMMVVALRTYAPSRQPEQKMFIPIAQLTNIQQVNEVFQRHAHDLGNHSLEMWIELERQVKRNLVELKVAGFYLDDQWQKWFDELEAEYRKHVGRLKKG